MNLSVNSGRMRTLTMNTMDYWTTTMMISKIGLSKKVTSKVYLVQTCE